jgi:hypothetical protein
MYDWLIDKLAEEEHMVFMDTMSCYHVKYVYIKKDLAEDCKIRKCKLNMFVILNYVF